MIYVSYFKCESCPSVLMCFFVLAIISLLLAMVDGVPVAVMTVPMTLTVVNVKIMLNLLDEVLKGERVGSLNGEAKRSAPDLGGHDTEGARHTKEDGVVVELVETVVHEKCTGSGINVGPGVGDLASCLKNLRDNLIASLDEVDEVIVLDVLVSELELTHEARVSLTENGVTVSWDYLAGGQSILNILSNVILVPVISELGL